MKPFRERNLTVIGTVALVVVVAAVLVAVNFSRFEPKQTYHADLADADQLVNGEYVTIAGVKVGAVSGLVLQGDHVRLDFTIDGGTHFGTRTTLQVKVLSPLGQEYVQLQPAGPGTMHPGQTIPRSRTFTSPSIVSTVTQLGGEVGKIDTAKLSQALTVAEQDVAGTAPAATASAIHGLGALSQYLATRQDQLITLLNETNQVTATLNAHQQNIVTLIGQSTLILQVVEARKADIDQLLTSVQTLSREISSLLTDPRASLSALLANLQTVSGVLAKDSSTLANTIPVLQGFATYVANATGSGRYLDSIAPTLLLPDDLIAQCAQPGADTDSNTLTGAGCKA